MAESLLVTDRGAPAPPQDVVKALKDLDERYDLVFFPFPSARFCVVERWRPDDRRRELIQTGAMSPGDDFDIAAEVPVGCSLPEVRSYLERKLRRVIDPKKEAEQAVAAIEQHNASVREGKREALRQEIVDEAARTTPHAARVRAGAEAAHAAIQAPEIKGGKIVRPAGAKPPKGSKAQRGGKKGAPDGPPLPPAA